MIYAVLAVAVATVSDVADTVAQCTSALTGHMYVMELLETESEAAFHIATHMNKQTFDKLLDILERHGGLKASPSISRAEKLMITLHVLLGHTQRQTGSRFQHSTSTISKTLRHVLSCFRRSRKHFISEADPHAPIHERLRDPKYSSFLGMLGAFDGCHISSASVEDASLQDVFRNRKGFLSQNVFAVCDLNGLITYYVAGWEGCAHDSKVFDDAVEKGFRLIPGFFYLGDAGYGLSPFCMTPYRGVRYHLKEWSRSSEGPCNMKELYNLRHSSLRNIIERTFGIIKKRFPILVHMPQGYSIEVQREIVGACFCIHNLIRREQLEGREDEDEFETEDETQADKDYNNWLEHTRRVDAAARQDEREGSVIRNQMAEEMWDNYVEVMNHRGEYLDSLV